MVIINYIMKNRAKELKSSAPWHEVRITVKVLQIAKEQNLPCAGWLKVGQWVCVVVGEYGYSIPKLAKNIKTLAKAKDIRESHNRYLGYTPLEVHNIVKNTISNFIDKNSSNEEIVYIKGVAIHVEPYEV